MRSLEFTYDAHDLSRWTVEDVFDCIKSDYESADRMETRNHCGLSSRFATADPDLVEHIAEAILRDEAWWIAARSGQYVVKETVWADRRASEFVVPLGIDLNLDGRILAR